MKDFFTKKNILAIISGSLVGFINGFFGGGGGMIVVPILTIIFCLSQKQAHATAIAIILPISLVSAVIYIINGHFSFDRGLAVSLGVILGGVLGALLLKKLNNDLLVKIFSIVMAIGGIKMLFF